MASKTIATNRKAYHNYHILKKMEAGIALVGAEVKSIRAGLVNFKDSFARIEDGRVLLYNLHIHPYKEASYMNADPDRIRMLLVKRSEIKKLSGMVLERGMVLVPTKIYFNSRGLVKVELALGRGKRVYDKREDVKKRELERALRRTLNVRRR